MLKILWSMPEFGGLWRHPNNQACTKSVKLKAFKLLKLDTIYKYMIHHMEEVIVQELCESRGGRPGLSVLTSLLVSVDVKIY